MIYFKLKKYLNLDVNYILGCPRAQSSHFLL